MDMESLERYHKLKSWVGWLEDIIQEFPGNNVSIDTAIRSFKSQLKEIEKQNEKNSKSI
jgi:hypothetical protein